MKHMDLGAIIWHGLRNWPWEVWLFGGLALVVKAYELVRPRRRRWR